MLHRIAIPLLCCILMLTGSAMAADIARSHPLSLSVNFDDEVAAVADSGVARGHHAVGRDSTVRFRVFGIYSESSGRFRFDDEIPLVSSDLDFEDTLGLDMDKFTGGALLGFSFGSEKRWHVDFSFNGYFDYKGTRNVGSIEFNGDVFVGVVDSRLQVAEGIAAINYDLWRSDSRHLTLNAGLDFHLYYAKSQLTEVLGVQSASYTLWVPVPAPSIALRWDINPNIYLRGSAAGLWLGDLGDFYDLSAEFGYDFSRNVGVFVGYRYWALHADYADTVLDFDASGIYAGVELRN